MREKEKNNTKIKTHKNKNKTGRINYSYAKHKTARKDGQKLNYAGKRSAH